MAGKIPYIVLKKGPFIGWELTVKESFDLKGLYKVVKEFMVINDWNDLNGGVDFESRYQELHGAGGVVSHDIWWRAKRDPKLERKRDIKFLTFYMKLEFKTVLMAKKETIINGEKVSLDSGELRVRGKFYLHQEWLEEKSDWKTNPILGFLNNYFWDRLNKSVFSAAKKEVVQASNDIYQLVQTYTGMLPESQRGFMQPKTES